MVRRAPFYRNHSLTVRANLSRVGIRILTQSWWLHIEVNLDPHQ